jgi:hypothetical protein
LLENTLARAQQLGRKRYLSAKSLATLKEEYIKRIEALNKEIDALEPDREMLMEEELLRIKRQLIMEEKNPNPEIEKYQNKRRCRKIREARATGAHLPFSPTG